MATRVSNFEIAADDAEKITPVDQENVVELTHGSGRFSLWRRPNPGAFSMMQLRLARKDWEEQAKGLDRFYSMLILTPKEAVAKGRLDEEGVPYADRVENGDRAVGFEWFMDMVERGVLTEANLYDMLATALEQHAGFPTSQPSGSSGSQNRAGRRSTASSRRQVSTPSA